MEMIKTTYPENVNHGTEGRQAESRLTSSRKYSPTSLLTRWGEQETMGCKMEDVRLVKYNYRCWIQFSSVSSWTCRHPKPLGFTELCSYSHLTWSPLTNGMSFILKITTPWCSGVSSVILPKCAFTTWFPYKKGISPLGFIHTWNLWLSATRKKPWRLMTCYSPCIWRTVPHNQVQLCAVWICHFC